MEGIEFKRKEIGPEDILSAAKTIPTHNGQTCNFFEDKWVFSDTYLDWAKQDLDSGHERGWSNAICNAKRAVCRTIDALVLANHIRVYFKKGMWERIKGLQEIGVPIPDVVYRLIIDPRNQIEHDYKIPSQQEAVDVVQLAELVLNATRKEAGRAPIVALGWNVLFIEQGSFRNNGITEDIRLTGFSKHQPMLFVDVFIEPVEVKVVDPSCEEVRYCILDKFTEDQSLRLAKILRSNYAQLPRGTSGNGKHFYEEMKRQGGF